MERDCHRQVCLIHFIPVTVNSFGSDRDVTYFMQMHSGDVEGYSPNVGLRSAGWKRKKTVQLALNRFLQVTSLL